MVKKAGNQKVAKEIRKEKMYMQKRGVLQKKRDSSF
jgi:hypothetical protein